MTTYKLYKAIIYNMAASPDMAIFHGSHEYLMTSPIMTLIESASPV